MKLIEKNMPEETFTISLTAKEMSLVVDGLDDCAISCEEAALLQEENECKPLMIYFRDRKECAEELRNRLESETGILVRSFQDHCRSAFGGDEPVKGGE